MFMLLGKGGMLKGPTSSNYDPVWTPVLANKTHQKLHSVNLSQW